MSAYERYVLPYLLDFACGLKPIRKQREKIVHRAAGDVLEIGIGTGQNMPYYDAHEVASIHGLDPATEMHPKANKRIAKAGLHVDLVPLSAEEIPRDDASYDTVLVTYTLCSIPDPVAALREMRRVLKPSGQLLFCEHGLAPDANVAKWQHRLTPAWRKLAGNCHMDRNIPELLKAADLNIAELDEMYVPGPKVLGYNYWGLARR